MKLIAKNKAWGGGLEILAMTRVIKRPIVIVPNDFKAMVYGRRYQTETPIFMAYNGTHYQGVVFLTPKDAKEYLVRLTAFAEPDNGDTDGTQRKRGGGGSIDSSRTATSSAASNGGAPGTTGARRVLEDFDGEDVETNTGQCKEKSTKVAGQWNCPVCPPVPGWTTGLTIYWRQKKSRTFVHGIRRTRKGFGSTNLQRFAKCWMAKWPNGHVMYVDWAWWRTHPLEQASTRETCTVWKNTLRWTQRISDYEAERRRANNPSERHKFNVGLRR